MGISDSFFIFGANYAYLIIVIIAGAFIVRQPRQQQKAALLIGAISFPGLWVVEDHRPLLLRSPSLCGGAVHAADTA
jgi:hypothetical protein